VEVGSLLYSDETSASLTLPLETGIQYNIDVAGIQSVPGLHITSHGELPRYQTVTSIPANVLAPDQAYQSYNEVLLQRHREDHIRFSTTYRLKEALIAMATFGAGNEYVQPHPIALSAYLGFIEILRKIMPPSVGFVDLSIRTPEVIFVTESGEFVLDAASGGILTLVDLAWGMSRK
jgi:hypothetical protein